MCPFHQEKTASFSVNPEFQRTHCFGCGWDGDTIAFVMRFYNLTFKEAILWLAERYSISLTKDPTARVKAQQAIKRYRQDKLREDCLQSLIDQEYARLSAIERLIYRVIYSINSEEDLNKPSVIWALLTKTKLEYYLNILTDGFPEEQLKMAIFTRGLQI